MNELQLPAVVSAALPLSAPALSADADVLIAPTRVVLEDGECSGERVIVNKGDEEAAIRLSPENRRMRENGSPELAEEALRRAVRCGAHRICAAPRDP